MASYDYDIANLALARLGQGTITSLAMAGRDSEVCNLFYAANRDYCLALVNWTCATEKIHMARAGKIAITGITAATPPVISCTGHLFVTGDLVTVEDVVGMTEINDGVYIAVTAATGTIHLHDTEGEDVVGAAWTAWASGGYVYRHPGNDWQYVYDLPTGCIKVLEALDENLAENASYLWVRVKDLIYCDLEFAAVKYIKSETDVTKYDDQMVDLMAARLAWLICPRISNDQTLRTTLNTEWLSFAGQAKMANADGAGADEQGENLWVNAR